MLQPKAFSAMALVLHEAAEYASAIAAERRGIEHRYAEPQPAVELADRDGALACARRDQ